MSLLGYHTYIKVNTCDMSLLGYHIYICEELDIHHLFILLVPRNMQQVKN